MIREISEYQEQYLADYGFEAVMVAYRRQLLLERLHEHRPKVVVEVGCGAELIYQHWLKSGGRAADYWVIVEPASEFAAIARASKLPNLLVVEDFFENAVSRVRGLGASSPDLVICSSLLHEVPSVSDLLKAIRVIMGENTRLHVNVPNAGSLHRRLAKSMGLISETKAMSNRNISLQQHRVYDQVSLSADLSTNGFRVVDKGGYLIKPFTHAQMAVIAPALGEVVMDGLFQLGVELPEFSSEIWAEAMLDG